MTSSTLKPWQASFLIHLSFVVIFIALTQMRFSLEETYEVPIVIEEPKEVQNLAKAEEKPQVVLKSVNKAEQDLTPKEARQVFGASRDSLTDENATDGIEAKKGNTLAKAEDKEVLLDSDATSLPTPTEEYLVSEMPSVLSEVKPAYPKEARDSKTEGRVVLDILIDGTGKVRDAKVLEGEAIFRSPAIDAIKKFIFRPAKTDGKPVAVRIRYTLNFKLEF
jgi:protein TonB